MNINIYYGGRGAIDDPTLYVINKMQEVLEELHVRVTRYNLYELKSSIATLPQTLKEADGVILASTVEWIGIGGYMMEFLDACWLYGDKDSISGIYMQPVVMSTTYGEKEGMLTLQNAWELLGGLPCAGLCGYVEDLGVFEGKRDYTNIIEKHAENLYRSISQKMKDLPSSNRAVKTMVMRTRQVEFTPQESDQLSHYVSNEEYVKRQKADIEELTGIFSEMLKDEENNEDREEALKNRFEAVFVRGLGASVSYKLIVVGMEQPLLIRVDRNRLSLSYGDATDVDVIGKLDVAALESIMNGQITFQKSFMSGIMTAKGNFKTLQMLDELFAFN